MNKIIGVLSVGAIALGAWAYFPKGTVGQAQASTLAFQEPLDPSSDPKGSDVHMAYEWSTFNPLAPQEHAPGAVLSGPGDIYRYTILREDDYASNPDYEVVRAIVGFHIDDSNPSKPAKKWARIRINDEVRPYLVMFKPDTRDPKAFDIVEVISDAKLSGNAGSSLPPFVYDVTDIMVRGENVSVEIVNLRQDGTTNSDANFGGFVVNRVGAHVWYKKK